MGKYEYHVSSEKIAWYFNITKPTVAATNKKHLNFYKLYVVFVTANSLKEQKDYLYSLKSDHIPETKLDHIWNKYISRLEHERDKPKKNPLEEKTRSLL